MSIKINFTVKLLQPIDFIKIEAVIGNNMYLDPNVYIQMGQRFGRAIKSFGTLGELRKQKKAPHIEVFYIWIKNGDKKYEGKFTLRSVNNCSNDQLTDFIKFVGIEIDTHTCERQDGEFVLELLYQELAKRIGVSNAGSK